MDDCLFCRIVAGEIPSDKVYEDEYVLAFKDIDPQAPVHVLIIPKKHYDNVLSVHAGDDIMEKINEAVRIVAEKCSVDKTGFRVITNCGEDAGQSVKHLHFHLMGGRVLTWPAG